MAAHSMKVVIRRTRLSPHVIRVWERRYNAVSPLRTETNRRLYSEEDVERLTLLGRLTEAGHTISQIARLPTEELRRMAEPGPDSTAAGAAMGSGPAKFRAEGVEAVKGLNGSGLRSVLEKGAIELGTYGLVKHVLIPLAHEVGELWQKGEITVANEHFASSMIRAFIESSSRPFALPENAPLLVVATPSGQLHELGAVIAASTAVDFGWRVIYLGPNLPSVEIAGAAIKSGAKAVALSIVYPQDDAYLGEELLALRRYLPAPVHLLVGGRAAKGYREILERIGASQLPDFDQLGERLEKLRR
jgi:methylmalonyl-CoA mutase cobalamin-binding subunit